MRGFEVKPSRPLQGLTRVSLGKCARTSDVPKQRHDGYSACSSYALAWCCTRSALVSLWRRIPFDRVVPLLENFVWSGLLRGKSGQHSGYVQSRPERPRAGIERFEMESNESKLKDVLGEDVAIGMLIYNAPIGRKTNSSSADRDALGHSLRRSQASTRRRRPT